MPSCTLMVLRSSPTCSVSASTCPSQVADQRLVLADVLGHFEHLLGAAGQLLQLRWHGLVGAAPGALGELLDGDDVAGREHLEIGGGDRRPQRQRKARRGRRGLFRALLLLEQRVGLLVLLDVLLRHLGRRALVPRRAGFDDLDRLAVARQAVLGDAVLGPAGDEADQCRCSRSCEISFPVGKQGGGSQGK